MLAGNDVYVDGQIIAVNSSLYRYDNVDWINIDNNIGYVMLDDMDITLNRRYNDGYTFFSVRANHGVKPKNQDYAYAILPGANASQTSEYASAPSVEVLANNNSLHAVKDNETGIIGANVFKACELEEIKFLVPCAILYTYNRGVYDINISDPTLTQSELSLEFPTNVSVSGEYAAAHENVVTVDVSSLKGKTYQLTVTEI